MNITIKNLAKFQKALGKFPQHSVQAIQDAFKKSVHQVIRETAPLTPIDTGRLVGSIGSQDGEGIFQIEKDRALVGTHVKYAVYVHEGHQRHRLGQRKFLEQGLKNSKSKIQGFFKEAYNDVMVKIARESKQ